MDAENVTGLLDELVASLIGKTVTFTRLAANSLILYIECEPGDRSGFSIWLEPTWNITSPSGVVLGSRQAQTEDDNEHAQFGEIAGELSGKSIESIQIDPIAHEIKVFLAGGYRVATFVSDPNDEDIWSIRDHHKGVVLEASPSGYLTRPLERLPRH